MLSKFNTRYSFPMTNDHNLGGIQGSKPSPAMVQPSPGRVDLKVGHGVPGSSGTSRLQALKQSILEAQRHGHAMAMGVVDPRILPGNLLDSFTFAGKSHRFPVDVP